MKKFTAGDNLLGMEKICHDIMNRNELGARSNAYELNWAATANSGPAFGGNQMDISSNNHGREVLMDIIKNAQDGSGKPFFTKQEIESIETKLSNPASMKGQKPVNVFSKELLPTINAALSSAYGVQKIDEAYLLEIREGIKHVENIVQNIKHPLAKQFYDTTYGMALLFDYHNQFNLGEGGPLNKYINGEEVTLKPDNGPHTIFSRRDNDKKYNFEDHRKFVLSTQYGIEKPTDIELRLENINEYFKNEFNYSVETDPQTTNQDIPKVEPKKEPVAEKKANAIHNECVGKYNKAVGGIMKCMKYDQVKSKQHIEESLPKIVEYPTYAMSVSCSAYITPLFGCYRELKEELFAPLYHDDL